MIQELLEGGSNSSGAPTKLEADRKISIPFPSNSSSQPWPSTTPTLTSPNPTTTTTLVNVNPSIPSTGAKNTSSGTNQNNLRCPRCDSSNTKFCYYNNYNLTQPRHFCKTCRRYWTKGGTLRNVPIGGGCRKNKSTSSPSAATSSSVSGTFSKSSHALAKAKASLSAEMLANGKLDHLHPYPNPSPSLWPFLPQGQSSHILALLRGATQLPSLNPSTSPNPNPISSAITTEGTTTLGLDPYGNGAPTLSGLFPRSNQPQLNGFGLGGADVVPNGGNGSNIMELYQRLKSSANYSGDENPGAVILGNNVRSTPSYSSSSSVPFAVNSVVLDAASVGGAGDNLGGHGIMTSAISSWSEFPTLPYY